jgi:cobalt-zinc-cadmium efflux system protein
MAHFHAHDNQKKQDNLKRPQTRVIIVLCLTALYMIAEAVGGFYSDSLALLADAGHMLADVIALGISLFAVIIASRPANQRATFGYYRAEVLAALFNGLILLLVSVFIIKEAITRLFDPVAVETHTMIGVALGGLVVNFIGLWLLHRDKDNNLNIKGAWLHVLSDTLGSIGVLISGLIIQIWGFYIADPIASIIIASLIFYSAARLVLETVGVLMEHTPAHINPSEVKKTLSAIKHVKRIHDLHIWTISPGRENLAVHVEFEGRADSEKILAQIQEVLKNKFNIGHTTIQLEKECLEPDKNCH